MDIVVSVDSKKIERYAATVVLGLKFLGGLVPIRVALKESTRSQ